MTPPGLVERWFGPAFRQLHPRLQQLHREGGTLQGPVDIVTAAGVGGWLGRRLARRLGVPTFPGAHTLRVDIHDDGQALRWDRTFDAGHRFASRFRPAGSYPTGYWVEHSGALTLHLGVRIVDGGWEWEERGAWWHGVRWPAWARPSTRAGKRAEGEAYRFSVTFAWRGGQPLLRYAGCLRMQSNRDAELTTPPP